MFSGGDSSEGINSLNQLGTYGFVSQVAVSNAMAAGQNIDWAQLAQQWIQMRDNTRSDTKNVSSINDNKTVYPSCSGQKFEEKGEADMDMDDDEQTEEKSEKVESNFPPTPNLHHKNMNQPWFFSEGNSSQLVGRSASNNEWSPWPNRNRSQQAPINANISNVNNRPIHPTSHIPSLLKINVPHPNEIRVMSDVSNQPEVATNVMDAAKRKGLPAWIREGLEKMEREKQKQLEREQQNKQTTNRLSDNEMDNPKNILTKSYISTNGVDENIDGESSDDESILINVEPNGEKDVNLRGDEENDTCDVPVCKTYEQKLSELMIVVRRTLTELLLEATNDEISKVADETVKSFKSKASSAQVIQKSALSTITGRLGLAAYGDSSSEENSDDDGPTSSKKLDYQSENDDDSEEEIRNAIRIKRRAFIKTSEEIEECVSSAAAREEEKRKYFLRMEEEEEREKNRKKQEWSLSKEPTSSGYKGHSISKGYEKDFGEITETKIQNINGKRQRDRCSRKERTTRFSDNKDKYLSLSATTSFITNIGAPGNTGNCSRTVLPSTNQRQNNPDINGLLPNYTSTGMANVLNAADAALEKVLKRKISTSPDKESKRHHCNTPSKKKQRHSSSRNSRSHSNSSSSKSSTSSSSMSTSSSDSDSSTSRSSHHSKYNHSSGEKNKSHKFSSKKYEKSQKDNKDQRKYSSSSYTKRDRESTSSRRYRRNASSDSDDEYNRRRKRDSHYFRKSSHSRSYTSSRRDREHSRSLSRSSYSSSSNRRQ